MLKSKKVVSMLLAVVMVLSIGCLSASAEEPVDTTSRGYQLIDGDVYDLYGNLLIKMYDGFTADGYALDPNFTVHDSSTSAPIDCDEVSPMSTEIFNGTKYLNKNIDGNQGVQLGGNFTVSSSEPDCRFTYRSGEPSGVNFGVYNITRGTIVDWVSNVLAGDSEEVSVYNSSRPNDTYKVTASAVDSAGNATMRVVKR